MENLTAIISISCTALGLLVTTITFIVRFARSLKEKRAAQNTLKLCEALTGFISAAEKFSNYSGNEKKEFVLTRANRFTMDNKLPFDIAFVEGKIEELMRLSKEVNQREKDKARNTSSVPQTPLQNLNHFTPQHFSN